MAWSRQATSHYLSPCSPYFLFHHKTSPSHNESYREHGELTASLYSLRGNDIHTPLYFLIMGIQVHPLFSLGYIYTAMPLLNRLSWWRHQMEPFPELLALCARNWPVNGDFPRQRPVTRSFDVFFDLHLNKRLSKQPWGWWFETPPRPLQRHCNGIHYFLWDVFTQPCPC